MKEIPLLRASDIEARVQQLVKNGSAALLLLYKSARTDMRVLDEVFGPMNWRRSHEVINGKMFCTISVWDEEKKEWVSKQDVGVPSNRDSQKGEASDSFKRAGFNWGIGRELYDAPTIFVNLAADEVSGGRLKSSVGFIVKEAEYDKTSHSFTKLVIVDRNGRVRWQTDRNLSQNIWNRLKASGVDPDDFAVRCCQVPFNQISPDRLQNLFANFDASVNYYKRHQQTAAV